MEFSSGKNLTVCFFDSGIGGLNLLCECALRLNNVNFKYFADNYNVPYGNLSTREITLKADAVFSKIEKAFPAAAVIACNTVTARCAVYLRAKYQFPIVGVQPAVKPAAENGGSCVVLATPATASSESLRELIKSYGKGVTEVVPCPELAMYIERNIFSLDERKVYLMLPQVKADNVVLGCTHYAFVKDFIKRRYTCNVFDGIAGTAARLCNILGNFDHCAQFCTESERIEPDLEEILSKVEFIGGDEYKNRDVFKWLVAQSGFTGNNFPKNLKN